jgi:hypothetical protein
MILFPDDEHATENDEIQNGSHIGEAAEKARKMQIEFGYIIGYIAQKNAGYYTPRLAS